MSRKLDLTPMELYFLGKSMHAKYIDYHYIAAMPDIQKRHELLEERTLEALTEAGIADEDFSGHVEIEEEAAALLEPVFFGETEVTVEGSAIVRIHILPDRITLCEEADGHLTFREAAEPQLLKLLQETVQIRCAKVGTGFYEKTFTGEELKHRDQQEKALRLLKGEIGYERSENRL